jgi:hypothetical protein
MSDDFRCYFARVRYNTHMRKRDIQIRHNQDLIVRKLQSATAYLETIQEVYQDKDAQRELIEPLQVVVSMLREVQREVLLRELTTVLHNEDLPTTTRKDKVIKLFPLLA